MPLSEKKRAVRSGILFVRGHKVRPVWHCDFIFLLGQALQALQPAGGVPHGWLAKLGINVDRGGLTTTSGSRS